MSLSDGPFHRFPRQISVGASNPVIYEQQAGFFALHGDPLPTDRAIQVHASERIAILPGPPPASLAPEQAISPVYAPEGGGSLAVPTGKIFLRVMEEDTVEAHRAEWEGAGYILAERLDYAPQAAWLQARSGGIADALLGVSRLRKIAGVESVEPQLLMQRTQR